MLKLLFKMLASLPVVKKLLSEYFAAENANVQKQLGEYQVKAISLAAEVATLRAQASEYKAQAESAALQIVDIQARLTAREMELERLQNETQQRIKEVSAMDSEAVFNASLGRPAPRAITTGFAAYDENR